MEVKLVIDGEEVILQPIGMSQKKRYGKFKEPEPYASMSLTPLIVTVYVRPGWKPSKGSPEGKQ